MMMRQIGRGRGCRLWCWVVVDELSVYLLRGLKGRERIVPRKEVCMDSVCVVYVRCFECKCSME